jgi:hypothetical protein
VDEIAKPAWNASLLHKALNASRAASAKDNLEALYTAVADMRCAAPPTGDNSTLVLHARMGDKEHIRSEFEPPLREYIRQRAIRFVEIHAVFHYAPWGREDSLKTNPKLLAKMGHLFRMTNASIVANVQRMYDLIELVEGMGPLNVTVLSSTSIDQSLCSFVRACHFFSTGGGFGEIARDIRRRLYPNCSAPTLPPLP